MIYAAVKAGYLPSEPKPIEVFEGSLAAAAKWVATNPGAVMIIANPDTSNPNGVKTTIEQLFGGKQLAGQLCKAMAKYIVQLYRRAEVARTEPSRKAYAERVARDAAVSAGLI